uniref:F-box domain-containing protein n=1 Tax=Meloidogyne hapla TaxID=6305 RepID=A0A1I8AWL1_MELHA
MNSIIYSLPTETKLDIFKFLNFNQLFSLQQTCRYFNKFIKEFKEELARLKFDLIQICCIKNESFEEFKFHNYVCELMNGPLSRQKISKAYKLTNQIPKHFDFQLSEQLEEKWKNAIEKSIPMYLQYNNTYKSSYEAGTHNYYILLFSGKIK